MPQTHAQVYAAIKAALVADGLDADHHLLGNRQAPSPLRVNSFRLNPIDVDVTGPRRNAGTTRWVTETIIVHLRQPMDTQNETSWLDARAKAESAANAIEGCGLQVVQFVGLDSELDESGNTIDHDLTIEVSYEQVVS